MTTELAPAPRRGPGRRTQAAHLLRDPAVRAAPPGQLPRRDPQLRRAAGGVRRDLLHRRLPRADEPARPGRAPPRSTREMAIALLALGLDPERCTLFVQSDRPEHTELAWLLATVTPVSWVERTPTYKEKKPDQPEDVNHGAAHVPGAPGRRHRHLQGVDSCRSARTRRRTWSCRARSSALQHALRRHVSRTAGGPHDRRRSCSAPTASGR